MIRNALLKENCAKMKLQYRLNFNSTLQLCYATSNERAGCLLNNIHYSYTTRVDNIKMHYRQSGCDTESSEEISLASCFRYSEG
jgi:hypothetical protein